MADKAIGDLVAATSIGTSDLFVAQQGSQAKSVSGQVLIRDLAAALDGHGGISDISYTAPTGTSLNGTLTITLADGESYNVTITNGRGIASISKTGTSGLTDTYTITYNNGTTSTFTVNNGRGITGFTKSTSGLVDTYTITYNDSTTSQIVVTNGRSISDITTHYAVSTDNTTVPSTWYETMQTMTPTNKYLWSYQTVSFNDASSIDTTPSVVGVYGDTGQNWYVWIKYSAVQPTQDSDMGDTADAWIGIYSGTASTAPTSYQDYTWYQHKGAIGDTGNGIDYISQYSSTGLEDTYRVYFTDGTFTSFTVTNGSQIQSIAKTSTSGLTDTYTVTLTDGTTTTFQVVNGKSISSITEVDVTHAAGHTDVYRINFNDGDTYSFSIYNGTNGSGSVSTVDGIQSNNQNVPLLTFGQGAPTTSTPGELKSRYFDQVNSVLYICVGIDTSGAETTYTWQGAGVTVDSAFSSTSTNPVQNAILTALLGTAVLTTTADNVTEAINELDAALSGKKNIQTAKTSPSASGNALAFIDTITQDAQGVITATKKNVTIDSALGSSSNPVQNSAVNTAINNVWSSLNSAHIYFAPSELGLTGTPTMKAIVDAMPNHSVGCFQNGDIDQTALTQPFGDDVSVVTIFKVMQYRSIAFGGRAYNNISNNASRYAFASYDGNAWKGWFAIVKEQELRYQPNDTYVSTKSHLLYGIITGGSTNFVCDVVLPKTLENITGVTVTAMSGQIKGVLGSVDSLSQNISFLSSPYSATAEKLDYNKIRITVQKSSAYANTTNNSPATYWGSISLKFT